MIYYGKIWNYYCNLKYLHSLKYFVDTWCIKIIDQSYLRIHLIQRTLFHQWLISLFLSNTKLSTKYDINPVILKLYHYMLINYFRRSYSDIPWQCHINTSLNYSCETIIIISSFNIVPHTNYCSRANMIRGKL